VAEPRKDSCVSRPIGQKDVARLIRRVAELEAESDELRETQRMLAGLMRNLPGMSYRCRNDSEWSMEFVSDGCIALTGYYPDDIVDNCRVAYGELVHPNDREAVWEDVQNAIRRKRPFRLRYRIIRADGETRWVWEQGCGVFSKAGELLALEGFIMDITERKRTEVALRASEERFRELFHQMSSGVMVYEVVGDADDFVIKDVNRAGEKIDSVRRRDVVGRPVRDVFPGVVEFGILDVFERVWRTGRPERRSTALYTDERISGWRENHVYRLPAGELVSLFDDVTERQIMENKILAKQRMEAIGTLAGGIANDFSNLLGLMTGNTSALMEHLMPNSQAHEIAQRLLESQRYAGRLTKRLLSVARASDVRGETCIEPVSVARTVTETVALVEHLLGEKEIACRIRNAEEMPAVLADEIQLRDVVMNILLNATKAVPPGGLIRIDAETRTVKEADTRYNPDAHAGKFVVLRFRDNGGGIPKTVIDRIFDPFFTTDETGASMGLGLSIVQSSLQRWGGWVRVRSREGVGASFRLFIPAVTTEIGQRLVRGVSPGGGTVLVVDDQDDCRTWLSALLKSAGYDVIAAANGKEAVALFRKHADEIAVSLVDVVMPGEDGKAVLEAVLSLDPTAQVVMMSGFSQDYVRGYLERGAWAFLQKPFLSQQLLDVIADLMCRGEGGEQG
jgi:two-component system, cell cycle sensor histidine kinase and response regulator CckA